MDCSTLGLPVHHQLLEFTQTHVYWVSDAIQSSHPLSPSFSPTLNCSQHQGLYQWVGSSPMSCPFTSGGQSIGVSASASILPMNAQGWCPLGLTSLISLLWKELSRVFSITTIESINSLMFSLFYGPLSHPYMTTGKTIALTIWAFVIECCNKYECDG